VRAKRKGCRNKETNHVCSICVLFLPLHLLSTRPRINIVCGTTGIFDYSTYREYFVICSVHATTPSLNPSYPRFRFLHVVWTGNIGWHLFPSQSRRIVMTNSAMKVSTRLWGIQLNDSHRTNPGLLRIPTLSLRSTLTSQKFFSSFCSKGFRSCNHSNR